MPKTPAEVLDAVPERHRPVADALRAVIAEHAPSLTESVKWGNLTYHDADRPTANVAAILVHKEHVNLQLWAGARLDDPAGLLEGTGKEMRHVKFTAVEEVDRETVGALMERAVEEVG